MPLTLSPSLLSIFFYLAPDGLTTEGAETLTLSGDIDITPILGLDEEANLPVEQVTGLASLDPLCTYLTYTSPIDTPYWPYAHLPYIMALLHH